MQCSLGIRARDIARAFLDEQLPDHVDHVTKPNRLVEEGRPIWFRAAWITSAASR